MHKKFEFNPRKGRSKKATILKFKKDMVYAHPENKILFDRLIEVIYDFGGKMSLPTAIGIVDLVKDHLKEQD